MTPATTEDDSLSGLLKSARRGDTEAIGRLLNRYRQFTQQIAQNSMDVSLQAHVDASDVLQKSMLEAFTDFDSFRGSTDAEIRNWLRRIVSNNQLDAERFLRRSERRNIDREVANAADNMPGAERTASSNIRRLESRVQLWEAIARLPERSRRIVELRHRDGLPFREIAATLNITEDNARKQWSRALAALRAILADG